MQTRAMQWKNQDGNVIVAVLLCLVLVTILGISASEISTFETQMSTNNLLHKRAFYSAESGLGHFKGATIVQANQLFADNLATGGGTADWDFILSGNGLTNLSGPATDTDADTIGDYAGAVVWSPGAVPDLDLTYTVRVWNNDDGGGFLDDTDGMVFVRSSVLGPRGSRAEVETLLFMDLVGQEITDYDAQEGAGSSKNYYSNDAGSVDTNFDSQL